MKNTFKSIALMVFAGALTMTSCKKDENKKGCTDSSILVTNYDPTAKEDDGSCVYRYELKSNEVVVSENITSNTTWTADKVWILPSRIAVESGAELTIEAGAVVKGVEGTAANASALIIAKGAKLMANGTATSPIIFTSTKDDITSGSLEGTTMTATSNALWGGLIVLGDAPISVDGGSTAQIEGIPASDVNGLYGGSNAADNSGSITYISVRHGGANIGAGNEINGITFGGVGTGTTVNHIEVVGNQDDGVEFFGGTVNVSDVIVMNSGDDAIDGDQAYAGTVDNVVIVCSNATDHAFEIDGAEGSAVGTMIVRNGTVIGSPESELGNLRDSARIEMHDIFFLEFNDTTGGYGDLTFKDLGSEAMFIDGVTKFSGIEVASNAAITWGIEDILKSGIDAHGSFVTLGLQTVGADLTEFQTTWSWAASSATEALLP